LPRGLVKNINANLFVNSVLVRGEQLVPPDSANGSLFEIFVKQLAGRPGIKIVRSLSSRGATDSEIEEETRLKLSEIRALLNLLHNYGVVEYTREKNMSSGWYTYTWKTNPNRTLQNLLLIRKRELSSLKDKISLEGENGIIYSCRQECTKLVFSDAAENNFSCPKCSSKLKGLDANQEIDKLVEKISALEKIVGRSV